MNIPFTTEQFFEVIANYNSAVWPAQILLVLAGIVCVLLINTEILHKNKIIGGYIGVLWIWIGIAYHIGYFTLINPAAYIFGILFILQGLFTLFETFRGQKLQFKIDGGIIDYFAYFILFFAIIIYPILLYFLENSIYTTITLGLPCPSTILTFGFFMLSTRSFTKYLLIIPGIWTIIGTSAAFNFGVYPDYMMLITAIIATVYLFGRKKQEE